MELEQTVQELRRGIFCPHVVVSPLVWFASDGTSAKRWQFYVVVGDDVTAVDTACEVGARRDDSLRMALLMAFARSGPCVVHDTASERDAIELCCALWPEDGHFADIRRAMRTTLEI